jgi:hypothetical protein
MDDLVTIAFSCADHLSQLAALASSSPTGDPIRRSRLIRMNRLHPRHRVITVGATTSRLRRNKRRSSP